MDKIFKKILTVLTVSLAIYLITILSLQGKESMNRFEWLPTECASEKYPMEIIHGDFLFADGASIYIPDGKVIDNGWGELGSTHIVGDEYKPVPIKLVITWFSYTEDKFFSGSFDLPFEKMSMLFEEGLINPRGEKETYKNILVGLAPAGGVSVWLVGNWRAVEVAHYRAQEHQMDWAEFTDYDSITRKEYIDEILEEYLSEEDLAYLRSKGVPEGIWETWRRQYRWEADIIGVQPLQIWLKTFNGEREFNKPGSDEKVKETLAVPKEIDINWQGVSKKYYSAKIIFNEEEIFKAFDKLSKMKPKQDLKLQLEISAKTFAVSASLRNSNYLIELEKSVIKVSSRRSL